RGWHHGRQGDVTCTIWQAFCPIDTRLYPASGTGAVLVPGVTLAPASRDQEIRVGDRQSGIELGELDGLADGAAIAVVEQPSGIGFVDDAVVRILRRAAAVGHELARAQCSPADDRREDGVVEPDRVEGDV